MSAELAALPPLWLWAGLGLALAIAELLLPGYCLIWLAAAALLTALATAGLGLALGFQALAFAVLALGALLAARRWMAMGEARAESRVNERAVQLIGQAVVVSQPIIGGEGRVRLGDGEWLARGADAPAGTRLKVMAVEGIVLVVAAVH